jgi:hypothetical protein
MGPWFDELEAGPKPEKRGDPAMISAFAEVKGHKLH